VAANPGVQMKPQKERGPAAKRKPASLSGAFRKRTTTPLGFIRSVASIATQAPTLYKVWFKRELDPCFRETLMVAVARFNDSKYCSWAHLEWAIIEGAPAEGLASVERMDSAHLDRKTWLAISFVRELVAADFGPVSKQLMKRIRASYTAEEIEEMTLVARVMDALNLGSNTFEAFLSRLGGKPSQNGQVVDEAIMSAVFCCALPPLLTFFSRSSKLSIEELVNRMVDYTAKMDVEYAAKHARPASN
jgi:alkylhydroperoxidase family enzyme